ncbi:MAG: SAM-dependent methyltransferase [Anaerolineae bacterium]
MTKRLACMLAPQRSTQYARLIETLALPELLISPLREHIRSATPRQIAGLPFIILELDGEVDAHAVQLLARLATIQACFWLHESSPSGMLEPIDLPSPDGLPPELLFARRYKGKTNEDLTRFLINAAAFASSFSHLEGRLDVLDPLAGGGTTLFAALTAGHNAYGIELQRKDVESTVTFLRQFLEEANIRFQYRDERLRQMGRRWTFIVEREGEPQRCVLAHGDAAQAAQLLPGTRPHIIVADLPYGVQHKGPIFSLLEANLPAWAALLRSGGGIALAWDATRLPRTALLEWVTTLAPELTWLDESPWNALAHPVDRVIKRRDILVARKEPPEG